MEFHGATVRIAGFDMPQARSQPGRSLTTGRWSHWRNNHGFSARRFHTSPLYAVEPQSMQDGPLAPLTVIQPSGLHLPPQKGQGSNSSSFLTPCQTSRNTSRKSGNIQLNAEVRRTREKIKNMKGDKKSRIQRRIAAVLIRKINRSCIESFPFL